VCGVDTHSKFIQALELKQLFLLLLTLRVYRGRLHINFPETEQYLFPDNFPFEQFPILFMSCDTHNKHHPVQTNNFQGV
jgi:hypothetical protein